MYNECALISILCGLSYLEGQVSAEVEVFCVTATPPNQPMRHASVLWAEEHRYWRWSRAKQCMDYCSRDFTPLALSWQWDSFVIQVQQSR